MLTKDRTDGEEFIPFVCPRCHGPVQENSPVLLCQACQAEFPLRAGMPQFYQPEALWEIGGAGHPSIESFSDWSDFLAAAFPEGERRTWITDVSRTMTLILAGVGPRIRVLDVGAGWGIYSIAAARLGAAVWALDANPEGMAFLAKRCQQDGLSQIVVSQGSALALPFPDDSFDVVLCNGLLELLPEYITEGSPEDIQCRALAEAKRVLRPTGRLAIAIENRYGLVYLLGGRDEHTGLRFITVLPRLLASLYSRLLRGRSFRIYTHSRRGLWALLRKSGLVPGPCYGAYPHYRFPDHLYNLAEPSAIQSLIRTLCARKAKTAVGRLQSGLFRLAAAVSSAPGSLLRAFPFSLVALASKQDEGSQSHGPREIRRTHIGWLERRTDSMGSVVRRYVIEDHFFEAFRREGKALDRFAKAGGQDLVPKVIGEEIRAGCCIRVLEDQGRASLLQQLQETRWSPEVQRRALTAFLRWLESARHIPVDGFPHKYEVMPRVRQAIQREPCLAYLLREVEGSTLPEILSNVDPNPGNLIFRNGALVLLDWELPCREHPLVVLGHFFLQMTVFADRFPPLLLARSRRPERCIGEAFRQAFATLASTERHSSASALDWYLWVATDFTAQSQTATPPIPAKEEVLRRLHGTVQ